MGIAYLEAARPDSVLNFVRARTPRGLRIAMLRNNSRLRAFIKYETPYRDEDGYLYSWFYEPVDFEEQLEEAEADGN